MAAVLPPGHAHHTTGLKVNQLTETCPRLFTRPQVLRPRRALETLISVPERPKQSGNQRRCESCPRHRPRTTVARSEARRRFCGQRPVLRLAAQLVAGRDAAGNGPCSLREQPSSLTRPARCPATGQANWVKVPIRRTVQSWPMEADRPSAVDARPGKARHAAPVRRRRRSPISLWPRTPASASASATGATGA